MKKVKKGIVALALSLVLVSFSLSDLYVFAAADQSEKALPSIRSFTDSAELELGKDPSYSPDYSSVSCIVISPDGSDTDGKGTVASPFYSLQKARSAARASSAESVTVYLREGEYFLDSEFELTDEDSSDIYTSYNNERAVITAEKSFSIAGASKVSDKNILDGLTDQSVRDRLYQINFWDLGFETRPDMRSPFGININGRDLDFSRYPNEGYLTISEEISTHRFRVNDTERHILKWKEYDNSGDYYGIAGFPGNDWSYYTGLAKIDFLDDCAIEDMTKQSHYGIHSGGRIFFYNVISEINELSDCALVNNRTLYFLIDGNESIDSSVLKISSYTGNLFKITGDGIMINGLTFRGVYDGSAISANADRITVRGCEFTAMQKGSAVTLSGSENLVTECYFHDIGSNCCTVSGGNIDTLVSGKNTVYNNTFKNWGLLEKSYTHAVSASGVGVLVSHNVMSGAPHLAIYYEGCDHIIEYNEIYDVCRESSDSGAIYTGRSYYNRGNIIRYNYFHDIIRFSGSTSGYCSAVYQDDCGSSFEVRSNVFFNCDRAFLIGGGRDNIFSENLLIDCGDGESPGYSGDLDARGIIWGNNPAGFDSENDNKYKIGIWSERFPEVGTLWTDGDKYCYPMRNTVSDNVLLKSSDFKIDRNAIENGKIENNVSTSDTGIVRDYSARDFSINTAALKTVINKFEEIPFNEIGTAGNGDPDQKAASVANDAIDRLPSPQDVSEKHRSAIESARRLYDSLSDTQKALIKDYKKLRLNEIALYTLPSLTEIVITECEDIGGWSVTEGFSSAIWNSGAIRGDGYFVSAGAGKCRSTFSFNSLDLSGAAYVKLFVYVVDRDDLKGISLNSPDGSVSVTGLENLTYQVGGWVEISPEIDYSTATENFDISKVGSITFESDVEAGSLALIGYDGIRAVLQEKGGDPRGDINADGAVTVLDSFIALKSAVRLQSLSGEEFLRADVDLNDKITCTDALQILRMSVGKITDF